jgi:hypothetical protein
MLSPSAIPAMFVATPVSDDVGSDGTARYQYWAQQQILGDTVFLRLRRYDTLTGAWTRHQFDESAMAAHFDPVTFLARPPPALELTLPGADAVAIARHGRKRPHHAGIP